MPCHAACVRARVHQITRAYVVVAYSRAIQKLSTIHLAGTVFCDTVPAKGSSVRPRMHLACEYTSVSCYTSLYLYDILLECLISYIARARVGYTCCDQQMLVTHIT